MNFLYLAALLISLFCMGLLDHRFQLALWWRLRPTVIALIIGVAFFAVWDLVAISLGIFIKGDSPLLLGVQLAPHFPLEELFFLILLCYVALCVFGALHRVALRRVGLRSDDLHGDDPRSDDPARNRSGVS